MPTHLLSWCCLICSLLFVGPLAGQTDGQIGSAAVVYLTDGSQLRGTIVDRTVDGNVTLRLPNQQTVIFTRDEISRIESGTAAEPRPDPRRPRLNRPTTPVDPEREKRRQRAFEPTVYPVLEPVSDWPDRSFAFRASVHTLSGSSKTIGFNFSAGIHFQVYKILNDRFSLGLGVGWDMYSPSIGEELYPVYAGAQYYPTFGKQRLYAFANAGYGFASEDRLLEVLEAKGGPFAHAGIGLHLFPKSGHRLGLEIGHKYQKATFTRRNFDNDIELRKLDFQRLTVGVWAFFGKGIQRK